MELQMEELTTDKEDDPVVSMEILYQAGDSEVV